MQAGVLYKPRGGEWAMDVYHDIGTALRRINELAPNMMRREDIEDVRFIYGNLNDMWSGPPDRPASDRVRWTTPMFGDDGMLASEPYHSMYLIRSIFQAASVVRPATDE